MKLKVLNTEGSETGKQVDLDPGVFGIEPNDHAIYLDVRLYRANQRQGTHKTKQRHELSGSTRKIKRQKGTGTARAGSIKSGVLRGGYRMHGTEPRDYGFKVNKKVKRLARLSALTYKAKDESILVLDQIQMNSPKTKDFVQIVANLKLENEKCLLVLSENDNNVTLSARNIPGVEVVHASGLNTYQVLNATKLVFIADALNKLNESAK